MNKKSPLTQQLPVALLVVLAGTLAVCEISVLYPGDNAPSFSLPTIQGRFVFNSSDVGSQVPIIFHALTNRSAFIRSMWTQEKSLVDLFDSVPDNTKFVFLSFSSRAKADAYWMANRLEQYALYRYFSKRSNRHWLEMRRREGFPRKWLRTNRARRHHAPRQPSMWNFLSNWRKRLHFVTLPVYELGNWIPLVLKQWYCPGHGCGLAQLVVVNHEGEPYFVAPRLDARYDWLPSFASLESKGLQFNIVDNKFGCQEIPHINVTGKIALIHDGMCSFFSKVSTAEKAGAVGVVVYTPTDSMVDMNCNGTDCNTQLNIAATMISLQDGQNIVDLLLEGRQVYVKFQNTPWDNFFFGIDGQGKVEETGWFLYPSMIFMAYQGQWFNYKTDLIHNLTKAAKVISVFNNSVMQGQAGVKATINMPGYVDLVQYRNVELDMTLSCPGKTDRSCPHWDHVVQLTVCCDETSPLCGMELGRWITSFRRRIGRWLTPVTPLLPLFTSQKCNFTMKTVPWAMAWVVSLNIRLSGKEDFPTSAITPETWHGYDKNFVPYTVISLFQGGAFNSNYNTKYSPITFTLPDSVHSVKLVAVITGHGSDNNNCAEFCVTSHVFTVNGYNFTRTFKNAGTENGCANRVREGVEPNEHGTWLYGRDGWCDGQQVTPWVVDITGHVHFAGGLNTVTYMGLYQGQSPNPTRDPGEIIMFSYLVYYVSAEWVNTR